MFYRTPSLSSVTHTKSIYTTVRSHTTHCKYVSVCEVINMICTKPMNASNDYMEAINKSLYHYSNVIMSAMASNTTDISIVYSTICSGVDKKKSKLCVTCLCEGNSLVTGEFSTQMASNAENASIWWCNHEDTRVIIALSRTGYWHCLGDVCIQTHCSKLIVYYKTISLYQMHSDSGANENLHNLAWTHVAMFRTLYMAHCVNLSVKKCRITKHVQQSTVNKNFDTFVFCRYV